MDRPTAIPLIATDHIRDFADRVYEKLRSRPDATQTFERTGVNITTFANGENKPQIAQSVRSREVYLFHSLFYPDPATSYMDMFLMIDALSRSSIESISLVLPYMSYLRQDSKDEPRVPVTASCLAKFTELFPAVRNIITVDMHSDACQGFYSISVDNLPGAVVNATYFRKLHGEDPHNVSVVSADAGGVKRATKFAKYLGNDISCYSMDKRRSGPNKVGTMRFVGDVDDIRGKHIILYDDIIDTGGTIIEAAKKLQDLDAASVTIGATHGMFSSRDGHAAEDALRATGLEVVITESIPRPPEYFEKHRDWLKVQSLDDLFAEVIYQNATGGSVSQLLNRRK